MPTFEPEVVVAAEHQTLCLVGEIVGLLDVGLRFGVVGVFGGFDDLLVFLGFGCGFGQFGFGLLRRGLVDVAEW